MMARLYLALWHLAHSAMLRLVSACLLALSLGVLPVYAQTTHTITLSGVAFSPSTLTIEEGDTVVWQNSSGFHNVNGSATDYPSNPVGFFSGDPAAAPFTFEFIFNTPGDYSYHCDQHGVPGSGMIGSITVNASTSVENELPDGLVIDSAYPNPFRSSTAVELTLDRPQSVRVVVYDALGREIVVLHDGPLATGAPIRFDWTPGGERSGVYLIELEGETFRTTRKVILVR